MMARLAILVGVLAAWMSVGRLHDFQNADSILPVLVSLQHWTPFYWEQDRFGMLVPLVAMPWQNPLANMLLQGWITTAAALLAPFFCARYLMGESAPWVAAGALANVLLLVIGSPELRFDWFVAQPHALSVSLAVAALLTLERPGLAGTAIAAALMLLAHWVNLGVCIGLAPLILLRRGPIGRAVSATAIGVAGGFWLMRASTPSHTTTDIVGVSEWPHGWWQLAHTSSAALARPGLLAAVVVLAAAGGAVLWVRARFSQPIEAAAKAFVVAVAYWLIVGTFRWVQLNLYFPRYVYPSLLLAGVALAILLVAPLPGHRPATATAACAALAIVSMVTYGAPSLERLRSSLDARFGGMTSEVVATGATVIVGEYWTVWPSVFHANLALSRQSSHAIVYGLTVRSAATDPLWASGKATRVLLAAPPNDRSVRFFTDRINLPVVLLEHRTSLDLFAVRP